MTYRASAHAIHLSIASIHCSTWSSSLLKTMEARSNVTRWGRGAVAEEAEGPPACLKNSSHAGGGVALSCTSHRLPFVVSGPVVRLMTSVRVSVSIGVSFGVDLAQWLLCVIISANWSLS